MLWYPQCTKKMCIDAHYRARGGGAESHSPTPAVLPATHEPVQAPADPSGLERSGSVVSTTARAPSFNEDTIEGRVAASMVAADTSAALMVSTTPTVYSPAPKEIARPPPTSLHRGDTLDRGMDVLASQDLSIPPEAAACARARKREQDHVFTKIWDVCVLLLNDLATRGAVCYHIFST